MQTLLYLLLSPSLVTTSLMDAESELCLLPVSMTLKMPFQLQCLQGPRLHFRHGVRKAVTHSLAQADASWALHLSSEWSDVGFV